MSASVKQKSPLADLLPAPSRSTKLPGTFQSELCTELTHEEEEERDYKSWATRYRHSAVEARARSETVKTDKAREALLKLAIEYDERAADLERKLALKKLK